MIGYLGRRVALAVPTLFGVTILLFAVIRAVPGGPGAIFCGDICTEDQVKAIERELGLDKPLVQQYAVWIGQLGVGDFGTSFQTGLPVAQQIRDKLPVTVEVGLLSLVIGMTIAVPVGVLAAVKQDSKLDYILRSLAIGFLAIPNFWLALLLLSAGSVYGFWTPPLNYAAPWVDPSRNLQLVLPPAILLGVSLSGPQMRLIRASMLDVLRQDYVRTAYAKGLPGRVVVLRHALRNAAIPTITLVGAQVPVVIGGTVLLETIFSVPGMGRYLVTAVNSGDVPIIQTVNLLFAAMVILVNIVVDASYSIVDPRIRYA